MTDHCIRLTAPVHAASLSATAVSIMQLQAAKLSHGGQVWSAAYLECFVA